MKNLAHNGETYVLLQNKVYICYNFIVCQQQKQFTLYSKFTIDFTKKSIVNLL